MELRRADPILILGGGGFLGAHLCARAIGRVERVVGASCRPDEAPPTIDRERIELVPWEADVRGATEALLDAVRPGRVVLAAAAALRRFGRARARGLGRAALRRGAWRASGALPRRVAHAARRRQRRPRRAGALGPFQERAAPRGRRLSRLELGLAVLARQGFTAEEARARVRPALRAELDLAARPADVSLDSRRARRALAACATPLLGPEEVLGSSSSP